MNQDSYRKEKLRDALGTTRGNVNEHSSCALRRTDLYGEDSRAVRSELLEEGAMAGGVVLPEVNKILSRHTSEIIFADLERRDARRLERSCPSSYEVVLLTDYLNGS